MRKFTGTKTIIATPCTRQQYNDYRGWDLPDDEDGSDEGFLVEYTDGGKPNHPDHDGYISWSPADVFAKAYKPSETHLERMQIEYAQLSDRLTALTAFIGTDIYDVLPMLERSRLESQHGAMCNYRNVLTERIEAAQA